MNMYKRIILLMGVLIFVFGGIAFAEEDKKGCEDHPLFTRMQHFYIRNCKVKEFDYFDFEEVNDGKWSKIRVEGRKYEIDYYLNPAI